jgi:superfamily I DNA and/or RNA helicase
MEKNHCKPTDIEINTVDSYQGREKEIMIFNCVRSNNIQAAEPYQSLGFLVDERRLNVAITRPKNFLFIIGHQNTLKRSPTWSALINSHKKAKNGYFALDRNSVDYLKNSNLLYDVIGSKQSFEKVYKNEETH